MSHLNDGISSTVGGTPFISLERLYPSMPVNIYAKLEMFNPGGSSKDRPAWRMLSEALQKGKINNSSTIIESSSGNTAIGLAQACRYFNLKLIIVVDPKINDHTLKILRTYGAKIDKVTNSDPHGNYLTARLNRVQQLLETHPNSYWPNQYANPANIAAQFQTMQEIVADLAAPPDYLLAATSTCGTIMGCANYVKEQKLNTKIVAVDAVGSVIFGAPSADRMVPGHGAGRPSKLLDESAIDEVLHITDEECITGCRRLLNREAILAGGSSGAVVMAMEKMQAHIPKGSSCAIILADSGERYLDTVFNDEWVQKHFGKKYGQTLNGLPDSRGIPVSGVANGSPKVNGTASQKADNEADRTIKIAIIGGGPKGTFGFERLAAQFKAAPPEMPVEIHVYNKSAHFGAGHVYRPGQPAYLLINNPVGDINMWIDEEPPAVADDTLPLTEWLLKNEDAQITRNDYTDRDAVGRYLANGFQQIASNLPGGVRGKYLVGEVTDICKEGNRYAVTVKDAAGSPAAVSHRYNHILLATGHPKNRLSKQDATFSEFAGRHQELHFVPFIYPVEQHLNNIPAQSDVAIKGIGLTFVDAVLALTEGRGGTFSKETEGSKLCYRPSGNEPGVIYPYSRGGLPMLPRKPQPGHEAPLKFFTASAFKRLQENQPGGQVDFQEQVWPLLRQEYLFAFYNVQLNETGFKHDLSSCSTFTEVEHHIKAFHKQHPEAPRFNPDHFLQPLHDKSFEDAGDFHAYIKRYLTFYLGEAKKGAQISAWAAATAVWRKATPLFAPLYAFRGLTPASQQYVDTKFRRLLNRVTFGPPAESTEKLIALMEAGILRFHMARNPAICRDEDEKRFRMESPQKENTHVEVLVDARIAGVSIDENQSPLYRNLLRRGFVRLFENKSCNHSYTPGCIAVTEDGFVIDKDGAVNTDIVVTGTPTEGVTFDNDALSRSRNNFVSKWAASIHTLYAPSTITENEF